ncbi:MAG TPA: methylmalonyl-CoA mutase, partial [Candidatus Marinimicrobia bacterium]|nr:methylmalonyl-CoA mutase [Candidatus Neomarinimicrobiota bacterium]
VAAIEKGWIQNEIARSAYEYQQNVDSGEQIIVGVNKYQSDEDVNPNLLTIDQQAVEKQIQRVKDFKSKRNNDHVNNRLSELKTIASGSDNIMPAIIECVKHNCTLGEISDALRLIFGEYHPSF